MTTRRKVIGAALGVVLAGLIGASGGAAQTLQQNNEAMFRQMQAARGVTNAEIQRIRQIFAGSRWIGQGNPAVTRHPLTPEQAQARLPAPALEFYRRRRNSQRMPRSAPTCSNGRTCLWPIR